jgi:hypothetical protein
MSRRLRLQIQNQTTDKCLVQNNPGVHEIGQGMKQRNTVALTTSRNEWADNNFNRSGKSRFGNLMPFNEALLYE